MENDHLWGGNTPSCHPVFDLFIYLFITARSVMFKSLRSILIVIIFTILHIQRTSGTSSILPEYCPNPTFLFIKKTKQNKTPQNRNHISLGYQGTIYRITSNFIVDIVKLFIHPQSCTSIQCATFLLMDSLSFSLCLQCLSLQFHHNLSRLH